MRERGGDNVSKYIRKESSEQSPEVPEYSDSKLVEIFLTMRIQIIKWQPIMRSGCYRTLYLL